MKKILIVGIAFLLVLSMISFMSVAQKITQDKSDDFAGGNSDWIKCNPPSFKVKVPGVGQYGCRRCALDEIRVGDDCHRCPDPNSIPTGEGTNCICKPGYGMVEGGKCTLCSTEFCKSLFGERLKLGEIIQGGCRCTCEDEYSLLNNQCLTPQEACDFLCQNHPNTHGVINGNKCGCICNDGYETGPNGCVPVKKETVEEPKLKEKTTKKTKTQYKMPVLTEQEKKSVTKLETKKEASPNEFVEYIKAVENNNPGMSWQQIISQLHEESYPEDANLDPTKLGLKLFINGKENEGYENVDTLVKSDTYFFSKQNNGERINLAHTYAGIRAGLNREGFRSWFMTNVNTGWGDTSQVVGDRIEGAWGVLTSGFGFFNKQKYEESKKLFKEAPRRKTDDQVLGNKASKWIQSYLNKNPDAKLSDAYEAYFKENDK